MGHHEYYREHLHEHLDARGDLAPPWERFPTYERYSLGWRMGSGESWLGFMRLFLDQMPTDQETRLAYLRRHAKAPYTWSDWVYATLHPEEDDDDDDDDDDGQKAQAKKDARMASLLELGLIASDVAYSTWLAQQERIVWPWEYADTPVEGARYWPREMWYWSRQLNEARQQGPLPPFEAPEPWESCVKAIRAGDANPLAPNEGLLSLARCFAAGRVIAPWEAGLSRSDFKDSFENDMGYVDAFRLWCITVFDDAPMLERYKQETKMPAEWAQWMEDEAAIP